MQNSHQAFLETNSFPKGELILRESILDKSHKIQALYDLFLKYHPDILILVGDNGENDPEIYELAAKELAKYNVKTLTFIHHAYSSKSWFQAGSEILKDQIGFVTPFEIALVLKDQQLLSQRSFDWMIQYIMPYILSEGFATISFMQPVTFPDYKDCSDFEWTMIVPYEMLPLSKKINQVCF